MAKKYPALKIDYRIVGWSSLVMLVLELLGVIVTVALGLISQIGIIDILLVAGFFYVTYKVMVKRKELNRWEWGMFIIVSAVFILGFAAGFIMAIASSY
jgi:Ni/Fe-hydrogenase subunit HybB-like protein